MTVNTNTLPIFKGDTVNVVVNVDNPSGTDLNITGYTFYFTAKSGLATTDANASINKTVTSHTSPSTGQTTIGLSATDTNITAGNYFYDIRMKDGSSNVTTLLSGILLVKENVRDAAS